ncbi:unnamed protein product [Effrenium voratum]|nr:unnamed protein product [Effrenium voratum]
MVVSATKHMTGASLNPSVSLALALAGRQRLSTAGLLCVAQVLGAITAAALCIQAGVAKELTLGPQGHHNWFQVGLLETIYACMMCLVYLNCAASKKNNPKEDQNGFVGIAVGFCYLASQNATQGICSTVSNSAIAIGLIAYGKGGGTHISHGVGYFLYDLLGAFLAAGAYRVVRPQEFRSLIMSSAIQENIQESALLGAEYIGTFYIVLTQVLTMLSSTGGDIGPQAWGTAAVVVAMVYAWCSSGLRQPYIQEVCLEPFSSMAGSAAQARDDDSGTDPDMPPLIPVSPGPLPEPKATKSMRAWATQQLRGRGRGRKAREARAGGRRQRAPAPVPLPEALPASAAPLLLGPGAAAPGASPRTVDFSRRATDLAAVLDKLPAVLGPEAAVVPQKRRRCFDGALEEIEVSAAASRKAAKSQEDDLYDADDSESEGEIDEDADDDTPKTTGGGGGLVLREQPPGAPKAESAGEEVLKAVGGPAAKPGGSSFGPRFRDLSKSELVEARQKWQLHSLAGVKATSPEENRKAAGDLFAMLRQRRAASDSENTEPLPSQSEANAKPVFRRPVRVAAAEAPEAPRPDAFTTPGMRILEECVAGERKGARRKAEDPTPISAVIAAAKKRKGAVCIAQDAE